MSSQDQLDPLLIGIRQAAELLSISERKLWELTNRGVIPCVRIDRCVRYDPEDLQTFVDNQKGGGQ